MASEVLDPETHPELRDINARLRAAPATRYVVRGEEARRRFGPLCGSVVFVTEYHDHTISRILLGDEAVDMLLASRPDFSNHTDHGPVEAGEVELKTEVRINANDPASGGGDPAVR